MKICVIPEQKGTKIRALEIKRRYFLQLKSNNLFSTITKYPLFAFSPQNRVVQNYSLNATDLA